MTIGVKLLDLTLEYQTAQESAGDEYAPTTRTPEEIAADYEAALLELVNRA